MKTMNWMMTLAMATALGCGSPVGKDNNDPNPDPDPHDYQDVTFVVTNHGLSSVFVDQTQQVLTIYHGNDAYTPKGSCNVSPSPDRSGESGFSGAPAPSPNAEDQAAPAMPSRELRPGDQWQRHWNGLVNGEGDCPNLAHLFGEELVVEFCYGTNIEGVDEWSAFPTDLECARQSFVFSDDPTTVDIEVDLEVQNETMPIVIENKSAEAIHVQLTADCGSTTFYTVTHGTDEIGTVDECSFCDCSEGADCGIACDLACAAPETATIEPGGILEHPLSLTYRKLYDEGTHQCTQRQYVPVGPLNAEICYGDTLLTETEEFATVDGIVCETVQFSTTDDEVRLVVQ